LPTLEQPPAHIPYAKAYPSGVLEVLIVGAASRTQNQFINELRQRLADTVGIRRLRQLVSGCQNRRKAR
jgi:hypothetical protein